MRNVSVAFTALALAVSLPLAAHAGSLGGTVGNTVGGTASTAGTSLGGNAAAVLAQASTSVALNTKAAGKVTVDESGRVTNLAEVTDADLKAWLKKQGYTKISAIKKEADGSVHATAHKDGKKTDVTIDAQGNVTAS